MDGRMGAMAIAYAITSACSAPAPQPLHFAVLGDRTGEPDDAAWRAVIEDMTSLGPDHVLTVGDLADDPTDLADWARAMAPLRGLPMPVDYVPGNHDIIDQPTADNFEEQTGQAPYRSFDALGLHFVVVDNSIAERWEDLPQVQRDWLATDLAAADGSKTVVLMHKPFWITRAAAGEPDPMHDLFVRHGVRAVLTGHWHRHGHKVIDGVEYVLVGSSGGSMSGARKAELGTSYELLWATVTDGILSFQTRTDRAFRPVESPSSDDLNTLTTLLRGALRAGIVPHADGVQLRLQFSNPLRVDVATTLNIQPGAWSVAKRSVDLSAPAGETWTQTVELSRGASPLPLPTISLELPLPDAGPTTVFAVADQQLVYPVSRAGTPTLDGVLDDATWASLTPIREFADSLGRPAHAEPTEVRVAHDGEALLFSARCSDTQLDQLKRDHAGERDGLVVYDDRVGMQLVLGDTLIWFYVTPDGAVWDLRADRASHTVDKEWNGVQAAAHVGEGQWTVEARVPFSALGLSEPPESMHFNVRRKQERLQAEAVLTPSFWTHDATRFPELRFQRGQ